MIIEKIACHIHGERTPSLVLYDDGYAHCFGCSWHGRISEIPGYEKHRVPKEKKKEKYVEDVAATLEYVESLPRKRIRGLVFPYDRDSYYVVFPNRDYYRRRFFAVDGAIGKYRSPSGVPRPAFVLQGASTSRTALFVEGEINALSLKEVCPDLWVFCPGGSGDFATCGSKYRPYLGNRRLVAITDRDPAGAKAALGLVGEVWPNKIELQLWSEDANEFLQMGILRSCVEAALGVSGDSAVQELGECPLPTSRGGIASDG